MYPDFFLSFGIIKLILSLKASFVVSAGEFGGFGGMPKGLHQQVLPIECSLKCP